MRTAHIVNGRIQRIATAFVLALLAFVATIGSTSRASAADSNGSNGTSTSGSGTNGHGDEYTVADLTGTLATAALESDFASANPTLSDTLAFYLRRLDEGGVGDLTLKQLAGEVQAVDWRSRLRWRQDDYRAPFALRTEPAALEDVVRKILLTVNLPGGLDDHLVDTVGPERAAELLDPVVQYHEELLHLSLAESLEKLRRYQIKYGPGSARLNVAETFLSYGSQWIPGFGPNENGWPGPFEWVLGYNSTLVTTQDEELTLTSAAQIGIRRYVWSPRWPGITNLIRPRSIAVGGLVAGEKNGPFIWPGRGDSRYGGFLVWGPIQFAYLGGDDPTVAIAHTIQLIPGLF
ncbi:MAG: hypothetical protein KDA27_01145 [Candidatus Eisenbacteria bacterium]|uniref:Uncharacterized protein n=1 Tax=Eiseniibacteriota bacterium TaxID=2212470 RepID=A0A956NCB6_UNCEI|nr:hypothetical protein [Candidatus Eisenbacteria bacterium]